MTTIASELARINRIQYLETLSSSDLAYWLIHSFSPERYRDKGDIVEHAFRWFYQNAHNPLIAAEFLDRLWGMSGTVPDYAPNIYMSNVIDFRKAG